MNNPSKRRKALVVDDVEINRSILASLLEEYDVAECEDGRAALDQLERSSFDIMFLDIVMPGLDGFQVLEHMRERGLATGMPVVIISSDVDPVSMGRAYKLGASDYVGKPFDPDIITKRADNLIRLHESEIALGRDLEYDRLFDGLRREIRFRYSASDGMLTLNDYGSSVLGVPKIVKSPFPSRLKAFAGSDTGVELSDMIRASVPGAVISDRDFPLAMPGGEIRYMRLSCRPRWDGSRPPRYIGVDGICVDVHDFRESLRAMEHKSSHDGLTGLLNHPGAKDAIRARLEACPGGDFMLCVIDLDKFKQANDTYGHQFGDKVLATFADLLRSAVRKGDITARMGGDEFLAFLEYAGDPDALANRLFEKLKGRCGGFEIRSSMGAAYTCRAGYDYGHLFKCADEALYAAKQAGRLCFKIYGG